MFKLFNRLVTMFGSRNPQSEYIPEGSSDDKVLPFLAAKPGSDRFRATEESIEFLRDLRT